ncbi:ureidoglycolate lyase [Paenibacillus sp. FSL R7-269]|uniref:fumarylacetoacetate hydrolase family protein n=1 Tax=Paenibacillus sp. FSL R7-269 TaxID=1226755 RepID=UPI0003E21F2B|nr:fumarylacetoacetate hydrolase family protein [Paenibacillus sp. FSL R7-269]ETT35892.1 ureidoglycolate lyase [Paenibacillus sp. FSL R7-269]
MKLIHFLQDQEPRVGVWTPQGILDVTKAGQTLNMAVPSTMQDIINQGQQGLDSLQALADKAQELNGEALYLEESSLHILPVLEQPEKLICVGLNYMPHIQEAKMEVPKSPVLFSKFNNALAAHNEKVKLPETAEKYDYEAEMVLVIGKEAKNVSQEEALSYVFGYSAGNDLSARDLQLLTGQWFLGKSLDQFAPVGPYLVTADEVDPSNLEISCKVNGEVRQLANTKNMIFDCAYLVSYISRYMTLKPGDLIFTGTPEGVILGYPQDKQQWLTAGDEVEVTIEGLGTLRNKLV